VPLKTALNRTWKFAANLECPKGIDEAALLTCLRSKSAAEIFRASWVSSEIFDFPFVPVSGTSFLPQDPHMVKYFAVNTSFKDFALNTSFRGVDTSIRWHTRLCPASNPGSANLAFYSTMVSQFSTESFFEIRIIRVKYLLPFISQFLNGFSRSMSK